MIGVRADDSDGKGATCMLESLKGTAAEFFEAVPDAIVVTDGDGRIVFMSTNAASLLGYPPEECVGWAVEMLIPEIFRREHEDARARYDVDARPRSVGAGKDLVARHRDGREIPVDISLGSLPTDSGVLAIVAIRDASERRRAEEERRQSEQAYRLLADNARDIVFRLRLAPTLGFDYICPAVTRITGFTPEEYYAAPMLLRQRIHPDDIAFANAIRASLNVGPEPFTLRVIVQDGTTCWLEINVTPVHDEGGSVVAIEGIARDVSVRKSVEEALRESKALLQTAIENLPFAFWAYDADGRCFMQNSVCKERWGDRNGERIDEMALDDAVRARWQDTRRRVMAGEVVRMEDAYISDGESRVDFMIAGPIRHGEEIIGVLGVNIDVTERHHAQDLGVRLRAAEESERLKDALLGTVSHELRSPISVIHGCATTALEYADRLSPDELMQYFRDIDRATLRLERLVSDLLIMSQIEAGALTMDFQPVDVESVVHEAVLTNAKAAKPSNVHISFANAGVQVKCDNDRILEVLSNLLENAQKFSPRGEPVEVSVELLDKDFVVVSVRDHGPGVAPQELDAIFGRFYRGVARDRIPMRGAGLGLAICRSLIQAHGGSIWASLPAGGGLQVSFSLPRV